MATHDYRHLNVWQKAMDFVVLVYGVANVLPKSEMYARSDQLRRASVCVPSNIAEGQKRLNYRETIQFSGMALGSLAEVQTQLILVQKIYGISTDSLVEEADVISKMLTALIKSLKSKI